MPSLTLELIGGPLDGDRKVLPLGPHDVLAEDAFISILVVVADRPLRRECYRRRGCEMVAVYVGEDERRG